MQLLSGEDFSNCVDTFNPDPTYDGCIYSKLYELMMEEVGCTVPWIPIKTDICKDPTKSKKAFDGSVTRSLRHSKIKVMIHMYVYNNCFILLQV